MLRVEHVSKAMSQGGFSLKDISFYLPPGYICGLIGENGAGKTTLMDVLMGLYKSEGRVTVNGHTMSEEEALAKECIAIIRQEAFFDKDLRLNKIGILYGELYKDFDMDCYLRYLEQFNLDSKKKLKELSRGMAIKVQLAFALSHNAKLFIFDEPTAGLDKHFREEFLIICVNLVSDGERSVLISSHITEDLDRIADYIAYIQDGCLLFMDTKEKLCDYFLIVSGEDYKLNLISKEAVVYKEKGTYSSKAMIFNSRRYPVDDGLEKKRPNIRELMYYLVKGGKEHAEAIAKKLS